MSPARAAAAVSAVGLIAVWITAIAPRQPPPTSAQPSSAASQEAVDKAAADVAGHADRLRERLRAAPAPTRPLRNPFRLVPAIESTPPPAEPAPVAAPEPAPVADTRPRLTLIGIGEDRTPDGVVRTAIITGSDQLFHVQAGATFADRFVLVAIGADAVEIRDVVDQTIVRLALR